MDEEEPPVFPRYNSRPCKEDGSIPPIIVQTNYYGELHCTRCAAANGRACGQIFAKQIETGFQAPIWSLDSGVRERILAAFREA